MKPSKLFTQFLLVFLGTCLSAAAQARPSACDHSQDTSWFALVGSDPALQTSLTNNTRTQKSRVCGLLMPSDSPTDASGRALPGQPFEQVADDVAGFVNVYKLSGNPDYKDLAQYGADWLLAWNDYLVANRDPAIPYLGWYTTADREGWFNLDCAKSNGFTPVDDRSYMVENWRADEAWDTAAAVRALLKYAEIDSARLQSKYFQRAKSILDAWPFRDHSSGDGNPQTPGLVNDGPYAAAGMRWYAKSNEPCEIRYVKNTNLVFGEQLFRIYRLTGDLNYLQSATGVLNSQLWEIITHRNFGYNSYLLYSYSPGTIYADVMAPDNDATTIMYTADGTILCRNPNPADHKSGASCWDHLGFEAYDVYVIGLLINDIDPSLFAVPTTQADVTAATAQTMSNYRISIFGNTATFPWRLVSPTYVTSYNCAQRYSPDPSFMSECLSALPQAGTDGSIFYSLVPDALVGQSPIN